MPDPSITAAIIVSTATLLAVVLGWWLARTGRRRKNGVTKRIFEPDKDDIYFMTFLLHDAYVQGQSLSSGELAKHHLEYSPLELEVKLIELEKHKYIKRTNRLSAGIGCWQMTPKGVEYMFRNGYQLDDLIEDQRSEA